MAGGLIQREDLITPAPTDEPGFIPVAYATQIIQEAAVSSMALSTFRQVRMPSKVQSLPVLDVLPVAAWVNGEPDETGAGGEKPATTMLWKGITLTAEEIAAIVVIPEAVIEDSTIDLWAEITPRIAESVGLALDKAVFAGTGKPASWPAAIIPAATAATNVTTGNDAQSFSDAFGLVEADGFMVDQVYANASVRAALRSMNASGVPIYLTEVRDDGRVDSIYGTPIEYDQAGALGASLAVVGDSSKAILGIRTDMQVKVLTEATIDISAAGDGSAMVNLAQQDSVGLRVRARFGFAVANPPTHLQPNAATRYPFAVLNAV